MANLAHRYLDVGFIDDAEVQIKKANALAKDGIEVHGNVGYAKNKLDKILESEESKEREILVEAEKEREFRIKYSEAFYCGIKIDKEKVEGIWKTKWGDLELTLDETKNSFKAEGKQKISIDTTLAAILTKKSDIRKELLKDRLVSIKGSIENLSARYKTEVEDTFGFEFTNPQRERIYEASGYMVIDEDFKTINIMEKAKDEKLTMETWEKKQV